MIPHEKPNCKGFSASLEKRAIFGVGNEGGIGPVISLKRLGRRSANLRTERALLRFAESSAVWLDVMDGYLCIRELHLRVTLTRVLALLYSVVYVRRAICILLFVLSGCPLGILCCAVS